MELAREGPGEGVPTGLNPNYLWVDKLPRVGEGVELWLSFPSGDGDSKNSQQEHIHSKSKGRGLPPWAHPAGISLCTKLFVTVLNRRQWLTGRKAF